MPLLLRFIRQNRWHKEPAAALLKAGDIPADPFADLRTDSDLLSVWVIDDDKSNLPRVVRAYALMGQNIAHTGYLVFPSKVIEDAGIDVLLNPGDTPDGEANAWHRDLRLSGNKLLALAKGMFVNGESDQMLKKELMESLEKAAKQNEFPASALDKFNKKK